MRQLAARPASRLPKQPTGRASGMCLPGCFGQRSQGRAARATGPGQAELEAVLLAKIVSSPLTVCATLTVTGGGATIRTR